jgi:ABC-type Fe3+-hydroxamate transport system substrate-binding protein
MAIRSFSDQLGQEIEVSFPPRRIVSLVPSQTELLADLGLQENVLGITKFCVRPSGWLANKTIIGGTKNFNTEVIDHLRPDLILGNKEENYKEGIEHLKRKYPVWMSDIVTLHDALSMIASVGELTDTNIKAQKIRKDILHGFANLKVQANQSVLYLIWRKPWIAAGPGTFIDTMLKTIGCKNLVETPRYPELSADEIRQLNPDLIFFSTEPYPFREKHMSELKEFVEAKMIIVDGEMFSWYGSRLLKAPEYFNQLLLC